MPDQDLMVLDAPTALAEPDQRDQYRRELADIVAEASAGGIAVVGAFL